MTNNKPKVTKTAKPAGAVVDLNVFRLKKSVGGDRLHSVQETFKVGSENKQTQNEPLHPRTTTESEKQLTERIERLKSSINRINQLMDELSSVPDKELKGPADT